MPRRLPSLNQLRAFEAAARHRSFKLGAAELCVTQASISHQIKALEEELGVPLFIRKTRAVDLTTEAARLLETLTPALDKIEEAALAVSGATLSGELKITAAPFYGNRWLLPRLDRFHSLHPQLTVSVSLSFDLVDLIPSGFDAALRFGDGDWPGLTSIRIHEDRIGPVCAPHYLGDQTPPLDPAEIEQMVLATTPAYDREWAEWFAAAGHTPSLDLELTRHPNRALAFDAALSGNGVCLADSRLTAAAERAGNLVRLHPATVVMPQGMYLVYPDRARPDARVLALAEWLQAEAAQALSTSTEPTE